jgi:outer membrane protein TolC
LKAVLILCFFCLSSELIAETQILSLEELLERVEKDNEDQQVASLRLEAKEADIISRDLVLAPQLKSEIGLSRDNRVGFGSRPSSHSQYLQVSVTKPFESGTTVAMSSGMERANAQGFAGPAYATDWEILLTQSLWRDQFGRMTSLRRQEESLERKTLGWEILLQRQRRLLAVEEAYWDLLEAMKNQETLKENLSQSQKIESWLKQRVRRSAAEAVDLLQVKALSAQRKLELAKSEDAIFQARLQLSNLAPGLGSGDWQPRMEELGQQRELSSLLASNGNQAHGDLQSTPTRLEILTGEATLKQAQLSAERIAEEALPDLQVFLQHGHGGAREPWVESWSDTLGVRQTGTSIGLQLSMILDADLLGQRDTAARLSAAASALEVAAIRRQSQLSWQEIARQANALQERITQVETWVKLEKQKAREERKRFEQGRSTTFQVISFEVDAAQAEFEVFRLHAQMRRVEGLARLYTSHGSANL